MLGYESVFIRQIKGEYMTKIIHTEKAQQQSALMFKR